MTAERLPERVPGIRELLEPLLRRGVDFVVVGGVAGMAQGSNYPSFDLDIAYARDGPNLDRMVSALEEIGVTLRGAPADLPFQLDARTLHNGANFTFTTGHGDLDIVGDVAGIRSYDELRESSELKVLAGLEVRVATIDHLIAMKRAANRAKDRLMLEEYIVIADERRRAALGDHE